ncbi:MurR/RpiR family transcriptional regulator [Iamia sp. SCSIO 61187]|uniref:MurR/RpiR family transcriptional regulator n=1 Tax=Iamia sp. SCSIO 61187 TaxID=2722752 RepID=UPI001C6384E2|nr:MurR/RpiR family transcriptional regulator [Iamia sp. SCSIO 61187]QYG93929.1 MurR/RpiR family transcriptional regulator [Iamia sp. SCSIO 61187]
MPDRRPPPSLSARLAGARLSPALRRVAELLLVDPRAIAHGTVASVATAAGTSPPTVVRLATALGYPGFGGLRDAAREELGMRLATDAVRARTPLPDDPTEARRAAEHDVIDRTLDGLDPPAVATAVTLLDRDGARCWVLPSAQTVGVALRLVDQLTIIGRRAVLLDGSEMRVMSTMAALAPGDVVLSMDVPRHEHALVRIQRAAVDQGALPIVLTGPPGQGLATEGGVVLPFTTATVGPFDSLVGLTVLTSLLVDALVERRRDLVAARLAALERTWTGAGLYEA